MCRFWSCILTRDGQILWDRNSNSHERILKDNNLKDTKIFNRDFVRIEIVRRMNRPYTKSRDSFILAFDEPRSLPDWVCNDIYEWQKKVWVAWEDAMQQTLFKLDLDKLKEISDELLKIHYMSFERGAKPEWSAVKEFNSSKDLDVYPKEDMFSAARDALDDVLGYAAREEISNSIFYPVGHAISSYYSGWSRYGDFICQAAMDASLYLVLKLLPEGSIEDKYARHIEDRMEAWRRGLAVRHDVNGKLFVVDIKKGEREAQ